MVQSLRLGFMLHGIGIEARLGLMVQALWFRCKGLGFRVYGLGFRV